MCSWLFILPLRTCIILSELLWIHYTCIILSYEAEKNVSCFWTVRLYTSSLWKICLLTIHPLAFLFQLHPSFLVYKIFALHLRCMSGVIFTSSLRKTTVIRLRLPSCSIVKPRIIALPEVFGDSSVFHTKRRRIWGYSNDGRPFSLGLYSNDWRPFSLSFQLMILVLEKWKKIHWCLPSRCVIKNGI